jgi:hypothetical protein
VDAGCDPQEGRCCRRSEHGLRAGRLPQLKHEGAAPDFIYTRNALHHLPDFWKGTALTRIAALLPRDGIFQLRDLVFSFDRPQVEGGLANWLQTAAANRPGDVWTRTELERHLRDEHSTFTWLLEPMIERAGFDILTADYEPAGAYTNYLCAKRSSPQAAT